MPDPLLYEINTRCWLRELAKAQSCPALTLAEVPDSQFRFWRELGISHLWLMGVWTLGPQARAKALANEGLRREYSEALPGWNEQDVGSSPYAIAAYDVDPQFGGEAALAGFRQKLRSYGVKLLLDFVPNHVGVDHPWLTQRPDLLVHSLTPAPGTFPKETVRGKVFFAHGKDPNSPAWTDTVQLDYRRADTRAAMVGMLKRIAELCDGVRCDMAMLALKDVFATTWARFAIEESAGMAEFWAEAISETRRHSPGFQFLAEVYSGMEGSLQDLGFDYTYDKVLYDRLVLGDAAGVQRHLLGLPPQRIRASAHFLENHDERRIASLLDLPQHRAAALVVLGLPGMRFLHEGQLDGLRRKLPVQLARRAKEPRDAEIQAMYRQLLGAVQTSEVGKGAPDLLFPRKAWADNPTEQNFILIQWSSEGPSFDLIAVNLAPHQGQCYAPLKLPNVPAQSWSVEDLLGNDLFVREGEDLRQRGLYLDLGAHAAQLLHFEPRNK